MSTTKNPHPWKACVIGKPRGKATRIAVIRDGKGELPKGCGEKLVVPARGHRDAVKLARASLARDGKLGRMTTKTRDALAALAPPPPAAVDGLGDAELVPAPAPPPGTLPQVQVLDGTDGESGVEAARQLLEGGDCLGAFKALLEDAKKSDQLRDAFAKGCIVKKKGRS